MRLRNLKNKEEIINNCDFIITDPFKYIGKWEDLFKNNNPIHIEIGMGMGKFIYENALNNPDINYIGIERYDNVIARAIKKLDKLDNLILVRMDARDIDKVFKKEIDLIYLNFSDPWPKKRHAKRRLTSNIFLSIYDKLFRDYCVIEQKTDNVLLFEYSLIQYSQYGYKIEDISLDLHSRLDIDNSMTEYEKKFSSQGIKTNYVKVVKK